MNPKTERLLRKGVWVLSAFLLAGAGALLGWAVHQGNSSIALVIEAPAVHEGNGNGEGHIKEDIQKLAKKSMSRKIVKKVVPPPPPPPKPPVPPLVKLVRLSGIIDFGGGDPPEAIIETIQNRQTKTYKVGDQLTPVPAKIEEIGEGVVVVYDEKRWKLTYSGVEKLSNPQGKKP